MSYLTVLYRKLVAVPTKVWYATAAALTVAGSTLVAAAPALATGETASEVYAKEAAEKASSEGSGAIKVFAIGVIGLIILIVVVFFIWKLIRRVMH